jgi:hypothetical protein
LKLQILPPQDLKEVSDIIELLGMVPYSFKLPQCKIRAAAPRPRGLAKRSPMQYYKRGIA